MTDADQVLDFWFGDTGSGGTGSGDTDSSRNHLWFAQNDEFDEEIRARFGDTLARAAAGELDDWAETARGRLALIIVLDQFSRNLGRGSADAFANDPKAQSLSVEGIERGHDLELPLIQRWFFYMPLEHAEDLSLQDQSVACFERLLEQAPAGQKSTYQAALDYAHRHRAPIARFGRFPHRNQVLGRESTPEELAHLAGGKWF